MRRITFAVLALAAVGGGDKPPVLRTVCGRHGFFPGW
jgi:hypothetical protein